MSAEHLIKPGPGPVTMEVTPESAGWEYLSFAVVRLGDGETHETRRDGEEVAIVPLSGAVTVTAAGATHRIERDSVFASMPSVFYAPPGTEIVVTADGDAEFAIGSAPAEGKYPVRVFAPAEMKSEVRGGGTARRQVNHILAPPLPAERLILYEVYVPRGTWSGWTPHCHDGYDGSPYLEETYYFRLDPADGFAMHRNWRVDEPFDEVLVANDGDCALVTKGYHSSVACPGSHMFFLNFLAGNLYDEARTTPPCFAQNFLWIEDDWDKDGWELPVTRP